ncbi:MAG: hypothetical protein K9M10_03585 [Candidatus Pacebacteria bacterium]|nr:hypothetical protein [Candidatus Paceibacterota bacterium]MCF7857533.1 hypothetical protein [Candidatus Paceibacterota bacterium]
MNRESVVTAIDTAYDVVIHVSLKVILGIGDFFRNTRTTDIYIFPERHGEEDVTEVPQHTFKKVHDIIETKKFTGVESRKNTIMYARTVSVPVYQNPTVEFDAQVCAVPYGEIVMVLETRGRFLRVVWNTCEGWVLGEDLVDRAVFVYPEFVIGQENMVDDPNSVRVRAILADIFGVGRSEFALQAGEYVLYRLWRKGIVIEWPHDVKPRVPGLWHKILKGTPRVHTGVTSKVGSVMEYMLNSDIGHLAYVEAVFPDDTITITEVNYPDSGIYSERVLTKEEWKELRPVFIQIL